MNTSFSLKRVGLILRADGIEYKRNIFIFCLTILVVYLLQIYYSRGGIGEPRSFGLMVIAILFASFVGKKVHHAKGMFLTLPAGNGEKFTALLLEGVLFLVAFEIMFWCSVGLMILAIDFYPPDLSTMGIWYIEPFSIALFFYSLLLLSYVRFKRYALPICVVSIAAFFFVFVWLMSKALKYVDLSWMENLTISENAMAFVDALSNGIPYIFFGLTAIVGYITFVKFKRKQLR